MNDFRSVPNYIVFLIIEDNAVKNTAFYIKLYKVTDGWSDKD